MKDLMKLMRVGASVSVSRRTLQFRAVLLCVWLRPARKSRHASKLSFRPSSSNFTNQESLMLFSYRTLLKPVSRISLQINSSCRPRPQLNRPKILGRVATMASNTAIVLADKITINEFNQLLGQYPALIKEISSTKGGMSFDSCSWKLC